MLAAAGSAAQAVHDGIAGGAGSGTRGTGSIRIGGGKTAGTAETAAARTLPADGSGEIPGGKRPNVELGRMEALEFFLDRADVNERRECDQQREPLPAKRVPETSDQRIPVLARKDFAEALANVREGLLIRADPFPFAGGGDGNEFADAVGTGRFERFGQGSERGGFENRVDAHETRRTDRRRIFPCGKRSGNQSPIPELENGGAHHGRKCTKGVAEWQIRDSNWRPGEKCDIVPA